MRRSGVRWEVRQLLNWVNGMVVVQIALGALTVLTARTPLVASLHVFLGAALLAASLLCLLRAVPVESLIAAGPAPRTDAVGVEAAAG